MKPATKLASKKRGPKAEVLKINMDWQEVVSQAMQKKKPKEGWPKSAG